MIADEAVDWGLTVKSVEIQDIKPSESMQRAMEQQASAEQERKAVVTRRGRQAGGDPRGGGAAGVVEARRQRPGDAGRGVGRSIRRVAAAVGTETAPMLFLLGRSTSRRWSGWAPPTTPRWWCCRPICRRRCADLVGGR